MPAAGKKLSRDEKKFTKRRSVEDGLKLADAAHAAVWRLYCETFKLFRSCPAKKCMRHRGCLGQPARCLMRGLAFIPQAARLEAAKEVARGGPRREPPASHLEWVVRREPLHLLMTWPTAQAAANEKRRPKAS